MTKKLELTSQISDDIERMLMNGTSLVAICQTKGSPSLSKVYDWMRTDKDFSNKIMNARKIAAQTYLDKMIIELENADACVGKLTGWRLLVSASGPAADSLVSFGLFSGAHAGAVVLES